MRKEFHFISLTIAVFLGTLPLVLQGKDKEIVIKSLDAEIIESLDRDSLKLMGNVIIQTDEMDLWSDTAIFDRSKKTIILEGNVKALSRNLDIKAEKINGNLLDRTFLISDTNFSFIKRVFGEAKKIEIKASGEIELLNIALTSCKQGDINWELNSKEIIISSDSRNSIIKDLQVKVNDTPVIYLPYVRAAIGKEKFSGFLTPSIKQGKDGLDLSIPYFFSLAPNYDLTISPRYIDKRGSGFSAEVRYLSRHSNGILKIANFFKDKRFSNLTGINDDRWSGEWNNVSKVGSNILLRINTEHVSDNLFYEDLSDDILGTQQKDYITRNLRIDWKNKNLKLKGQINKFQNLNPFASNDYDSEPSLTLNFHKKLKELNIGLDASYSEFSFEDSFNPFERKNNVKRTSITPSLGFSNVGISSLSTLTVGRTDSKHKYDSSSLDNSRNWAEVSHKIYMDNYGNNAFRSLSPIVKLIWIDGKNKEISQIDSKIINLDLETLLRRNWYSGNDLFLEKNRIILGFEHNYVNQNSGKERYFSVAKSFFSNKDFNRINEKKHSSSIVTAFNSEITDNLHLVSELEIDEDFENILTGSMGIKFNKDERKNIELRSIYKRDFSSLNSYPWSDRELPINQFEIISQWEISHNILLFGKVLKDIESNMSKDITYGFEYSNCCLKFGLMKRKWIDQDYYALTANQANSANPAWNELTFEKERDNLYFFFELIELGRFGKEISEVLSSKSFQ